MPTPTAEPETARGTHRTDSGFTLIEVLVVLLLVGLLIKIVVTNMGAWIPDSALDAQANKFRAWIDYLRSEAKIQGKPYSLELDLDNHRMRLVLPPEDRLVTTRDDTVATTIPLDWSPLEDHVRFAGHSVSGREVLERRKVQITFDENGFTADQSVYFRYAAENAKLLWTVHIHGLSGTSEVVRNREGTRAIFPAVEQANF